MSGQARIKIAAKTPRPPRKTRTIINDSNNKHPHTHRNAVTAERPGFSSYY
jgi:hypothetical protein